MAKSRKKQTAEEPQETAEVTLQPITETIEKNYMPYVMTSIISRAIPAIDGFKPSHRKLLYTMYKMGLLTGQRTKSANVVGQTMRLNPHGDMAIYETMVRLTRGNETLLHPFVDSKGSFGKQYSTMAFAGDFVIAEVEEIVEVGELGPEEIHVPAPIVDMVYVRTGEKRPLCPMWQRAKAKAEAKAREKAEGGNK